MRINTTILCATLALAGRAQDSERLLPLQVSVTAGGAPCKQFTVALYQGNTLVTELPPSKRGAFQLHLDLNERFTVRIGKVGYRDKIIAVHTMLPESATAEAPVAYTVDMEPLDRFAHADPFYLDFPCAIVQWDEAAGRFSHSEHYLADIQLKMALLSAQAAVE